MTAHHLVLLHGFTQTGAVWNGIASGLVSRLGHETTITSPDLPGHGVASGDGSSLATTADRLAASVERGIVIGYSMGGRVALHLALAHPDRVDGLVLIGAHPGIENEAERSDRRRDDESLAEEIETIGVEAFLARWLAQPLFAGLSDDRADLPARRANTATGLASSLRSSGVGTQVPLWDRLGAISCPTLVIAGEADTKYTGIARRTADLIAGARVAIIPGAGHAAHLERPEITVAVIADWIAGSRGDDADR